MFSRLIDLWKNWQARRTVRDAISTLEDRFADKSVECVVCEDLTLSTYIIEAEPSFLSWNGEAYFPFWAKALQVTVYTDGSEPSDEQLRMLRTMIEYPDSIRDEALTRYAAFYNRAIYPNRENFRDVMELPAVRTTKEIHALVGDPEVRIDELNAPEPLRFALTFYPLWRDGDHTDMFITNWSVDDPLFAIPS